MTHRHRAEGAPAIGHESPEKVHEIRSRQRATRKRLCPSRDVHHGPVRQSATGGKQKARHHQAQARSRTARAWRRIRRMTPCRTIAGRAHCAKRRGDQTRPIVILWPHRQPLPLARGSRIWTGIARAGQMRAAAGPRQSGVRLPVDTRASVCGCDMPRAPRDARR